MTEDDNPFHVSYEITSEAPYEKSIAHGMLIMSLFDNENLHFLIDIAEKKKRAEKIEVSGYGMLEVL